MKKASVLTILVCLLVTANFALADTIRGINMDFVTIGNAGNAGEQSRLSLGDTKYYGGVNYNYRIGKYEVTNAQWNAFTAAAGAPNGTDGGYSYGSAYLGAQKPVTRVSWYETLQFCNYLTSGDKSKGAYQFSGNKTNPGSFLGIDRTAAQAAYGTIYVIPTEDEWYKAAYHKNDGITGNYWLYPTQSNDLPSNDLINPDPGNNANFYQNGYTIGSPNYLTAVGEFENSDSAYGTFDQGGNVFEWNETLIGSDRRLRGGSFYDMDWAGNYLLSSRRSIGTPYYEYDNTGFRVASIPEPASLLILALGGLALRRRHCR